MTANARASSGRPLMDNGMAPRPMDLNINPVLPSSRCFMGFALPWVTIIYKFNDFRLGGISWSPRLYRERLSQHPLNEDDYSVVRKVWKYIHSG
jgi:hypothetical protein